MAQRPPRELSHALVWWQARECFRFKYRDPFDGQVRYMCCVPARFAEAGIEIPSPEVVRKPTEKAKGLARRLRAAFLKSLAAVRPETIVEVPTVGRVIDEYFNLHDHQSPSYRANLERTFAEFAETVGQDRRIDQVEDRDLKAFERGLLTRICGRALTLANLQVHGTARFRAFGSCGTRTLFS